MKKTLLAVAVAAALPAVAFAQTNVTLYGIADVGVGWGDSGASGKSSTMFVNSGIQSTSRLGIRGSEDLGNGLKATFNLEQGVLWDTGNNDGDRGRGTWQRRSVVGLAGSWGAVNLGRDYTPGFMSTVSNDVMGYGLYGNWLNWVAVGGGTGVRGSNGIHYVGTFSGVTLRAMYAEGEQVAPKSSAGDQYGVSAVYAGGPLNLQGYYEHAADNAANKVDRYGIGAGYRFGDLRLAANYGHVKPKGAKKVQAYGIGASIGVGTGSAIAQVMQIKDDNTDGKATLFGIAYVHPLSKRTNLYASFGMTSNNSKSARPIFASDTGVGGPMNPSGTFGDDPKAFAVGIRHMF